MDFNKTMLASSIVAALGATSFTAQADLTTSATLNFTLGIQQTIACNYGTTPPCGKTDYNITDIIGSYFGVDNDNSGALTPDEKFPTGSLNGIHIGDVQAASGSHNGVINGTENPDIDNPWTFFGDTGMHQTTSPITDLTGTGSVRTLDFSGWNITWSGIANIPLVDLGTTITCDTSSCSAGSNYTLDGEFDIVANGMTTTGYFLHLEGEVASIVPIPAAAWLFASGLAGLAGVVARRRKSG